MGTDGSGLWDKESSVLKGYQWKSARPAHQLMMLKSPYETAVQGWLLVYLMTIQNRHEAEVPNTHL